jgi:hypothetical protein
VTIAPEMEPRTAPQSQRSGGRIGVVVLLVVALIAADWTRDQTIQEKASLHSHSGLPGAAATADTGVGTLPSYATALLLGGLRGPLVMILWMSSENQKQEHDLQDFDTKVEWIRLLQPEFDTVHLFQIWNKAYNISVQMASLRNKYTTILDAIDYGQKVETERPDDINIITAVAMIYGDKLGTSQEHVYYRHRVRRETQTLIRVEFPENRTDDFRAAAAKTLWNENESPLEAEDQTHTVRVVMEPINARALQNTFSGAGITYSPETRRESTSNDPSWRRVRLDPMLDENGNVLPALLVPRYPRPDDVSASAQWYDGSQLQFLPQYGPYPYGISTLALAFNSYKQAQLLQTLWNQHHIQTGDTVVDARPALTLKQWANDEWERGRRFELDMWGQFVPESDDPIELESPTMDVAFDKAASNRMDYEAALYSYALGERLFKDSLAEYERHILAYKANASVYFVHIDDATSGQEFMAADHDYLAAADATGEARHQLLQSAAMHYHAAELHYAVTILKYYVDDAVMAQAFPKDPHTHLQFTRATIASSDPQTWIHTLHDVMAANARYLVDPVTHQYLQARDTYADDRKQYLIYVGRCDARLRQLATDGIPTPQ